MVEYSRLLRIADARGVNLKPGDWDGFLGRWFIGVPLCLFAGLWAPWFGLPDEVITKVAV
jgi:hypothetical protein